MMTKDKLRQLKGDERLGQMRESEYLGAEDIDDGAEPVLTIAGLWNGTVTLQRGKENKDVLSFAEERVPGIMQVLDMNDMAPVGAALLAGVGAGIFKDVYEASAKVEKTVYMEIKHSDAYNDVYDRRYRVYTGLYPSIHQLYKVNLGMK